MTYRLHPEILRACYRSDAILWNAFARSNCSAQNVRPKGRLSFPHYRNANLRASEQEARFAFVEALLQGSLHYSIETPTSKCYRFSGGGVQSAQTDLTVRDANMVALCNVEFKSGGFTSENANLLPIAKDMEKLVREPVSGLWYHLLEGANNKTINQLLDVLANKGRRPLRDIDSPGLTIHICILRQRFSIQKNFSVPLSENDDLAIGLSLSRTELRDIKDSNGWFINRDSTFPKRANNSG